MIANAAFAILAGAFVGAVASFLAYDPVVIGVFQKIAFTPEVVQSQRGLEIYAHGLSFPYLLVSSPIVFLAAFPFLHWVVLRWVSPRQLRAATSGASAWSALSLALALSPPNLSNADLDNAARLFGMCFAGFMGVTGAVAGFVVSLLTQPSAPEER